MKIRIANTIDPTAQAVPELTLGLILALARRILERDRLLRDGHWPKRELVGHLLRGKTLSIVGAGNIGSRVGRMGAAWGMRPLGCIDPPLPHLLAEPRAVQPIETPSPSKPPASARGASRLAQAAQKLDMSMSELYTAALAAYVATYQEKDVTEKLDAIYETEPSSLNPELVAMQVASTDDERW